MTAYVDLPGTGTTRVDAPDSAGLSLTGDLDLRCLVHMNDWTPSAFQAVMAHRGGAGNRSWNFGVNAAGTLAFGWSILGTTEINTASTVSTGRTDGLHLWLRVTHDVDNGAVGNDVTYYTSTDPITTAPGSVTWVQLGTVVTTAAPTSHFNSTNEIELGANTDGASSRMIGRHYYAELRSSIAGTIVGSPDFRTDAQITTPNTVFTDSQTNAWTLRTAATWVIENLTATGTSTLAGVTSAGAGVFGSVTGTGTSTLAGVTSAGAGILANLITGTGASTLQGVTSAGVGVVSGMGPIPGSGGARMGGNAIRKPPRLNLTRRRR